MMIWFKCKKENLTFGIESELKPSIGDTVHFQNKQYTVKKVIWCLNNPPAQSGLIAEIEKDDIYNKKYQTDINNLVDAYDEIH